MRRGKWVPDAVINRHGRDGGIHPRGGDVLTRRSDVNLRPPVAEFGDLLVTVDARNGDHFRIRSRIGYVASSVPGSGNKDDPGVSEFLYLLAQEIERHGELHAHIDNVRVRLRASSGPQQSRHEPYTVVLRSS